MPRLSCVVLVSTVLLMTAGCGHYAGTTRNPTFAAPTADGPTAVVAIECESSKPYHGGVTPAAAAFLSLHKSKLNVDPTRSFVDPTDAMLVCSTFGQGAQGIYGSGFDGKKWTVSSTLRDFVKGVGASASAKSVLISLIVYQRNCTNDSATVTDERGRNIGTIESNRVRCGEPQSESLRELLFSADGTLLWKTWGSAMNDVDAVEKKLAPMLAQIPAEKFVAGRAVVLPTAMAMTTPPPSSPAAADPPLMVTAASAPDAPPPETADTLVSRLASSATPECGQYARTVCTMATLGACRDAVALANAKSVPDAKCKVMKRAAAKGAVAGAYR